MAEFYREKAEGVGGLKERIRKLEEENRQLKEKLEEKEKEIKELKEVMICDPLTGLFNRRYFENHLKDLIEEIKHPLKEGIERREEKIEKLSLLFIDIDNFKKINDTYGHLAGDKVLKMVSNKLKENVRAEDLVCRWGGEEILVALVDSGVDEAKKKAEFLRKRIEDLEIEREKSIKPTVSIGVAELTEDDDFNSLIEKSDKAMYEAKRRGKNKVVSFEEINPPGSSIG